VVARPLFGGYQASSAAAQQWRMAPWAAYTPTWSSSGSAPALGNGTIVGGFRREGTTLHVRGKLNVGSGSTVGTGDLRISLPSGLTACAAAQQTMAAFWYDAGVGVNPGVCIAQASAAYVVFNFGGGVTFAATSGLANGDEINFAGTIEIEP